jgi:glycosyltransferase involved in cell wall biosynthesis
VKISIITVAYNAAATIGDTCASVAAQIGPEIEHIIIDGGSTDGTSAVVSAKAKPGHIFLSEPDNGLYDAMNKGIKRATGNLVGFLNADDFLCRTDAGALIAAAATANQTASAICGGVAIVAAADVTRLRRAYAATSFAPWMLRFGHMPPHPGFYVRRTALDTVGPFEAEMKIGADFDWMVRFFWKHQLRLARIAPTIVTMRDGGVSNGGWKARRRMNSEILAALRNHGVASMPVLVWSKYLAKIAQVGLRARSWPAPEQVRWP